MRTPKTVKTTWNQLRLLVFALDGTLDDVPEGDFYMKGGIDEVRGTAKK